ncbi:MAG: 50S ribosomal protein L9 [Candidatus Omnitrophica bacterium]|nr:50S ribosomal protein L9 [Candidatus Omnitrophota bacterium]
MEVILSQDVKGLGYVGDVVKVKDGYARNFIFPQELGFLATPANLKKIEQQKKRRQVEYDTNKKNAQELADKLSKVSCTVAVEVNDLDKLYGSVTEVDIAKSLEVEGYVVDKKLIEIEKPIQELGIFDVPIKLHSEVTAKIRVWVTKK